MRRAATALSILIASIAVVRCSGTEGPSSVSVPGAESQLNTNRVAAATAAGVLPSARPGVSWIAEVHSSAMEHVVANARRLRSSDKRGRCAFLQSVIRSNIPRIRQETGVTDPQLYETLIEQANHRIGCAASGRLSVFGRPLALQEDTLTGAWTNYEAQLQDAIENSVSPSDAAARLDGVLVQASNDGLGAGDFYVLSAITSLGASSVYYWYEVEQAGYSPRDSLPAQMSIFGSYGLCGRWCRIGLADVAGALFGSMIGMPAGGSGALVGAVIGGIAASGAYWLLS